MDPRPLKCLTHQVIVRPSIRPLTLRINAMASVHQKVATGQRDVRLRSLDGCQTCRRRRVKCDESKPRCNGCIRLNHSCSWTRDWKFKDHTSLVARGYRVSAGPQDSDQYRPTSTGIMASLQWLPVWNACPADADMDHDLEVPLYRIQRPQKLRSRECRMPLQLDNVLTERSQLLNSALFHYLPSDEYNLGKEGLDASASINILTLHNRPISNPQSSALKAAIDTFSLAQAALVLGDARFAAASVRRYVVGVAALRSALSRPQDSSRDELILAMLIFQLVEVRLLVAEHQRSRADMAADHETNFAKRGLGGAQCRRSEVC